MLLASAIQGPSTSYFFFLLHPALPHPFSVDIATDKDSPNPPLHPFFLLISSPNRPCGRADVEPMQGSSVDGASDIPPSVIFWNRRLLQQDDFTPLMISARVGHNNVEKALLDTAAPSNVVSPPNLLCKR
ncbi:unnamed protein product [Lactuca virosa]|uniref:Uncharacterized protein n=1 Tax=Lactuca virosa TaxID=75947 RepID=A0AAU9MTI9_9ASTR|nr:unnamed protein product [Lactuca virosa]